MLGTYRMYDVYECVLASVCTWLHNIVTVTGALRPVDFTRDFSVLNTQSRLQDSLRMRTNQ